MGKNKKNKQKDNFFQLPLDELIQKAKHFDKQENYHNLLMVLKSIKKIRDDKPIRSWIVRTYRKLAFKQYKNGMCKEAIVTLNQISAFSELGMTLDDSLLLAEIQIKLGDWDQALQHISVKPDLFKDMDSESKDKIKAFREKVADKLPALPEVYNKLNSEDDFRKGAEKISSSLDFFDQGNYEEILLDLKNIPFDSPFKNWKIALKGMIYYHQGNFEQSNKMMLMLPKDSILWKFVSIYWILNNSNNSAELNKIDKTFISKQNTQFLERLPFQLLLNSLFHNLNSNEINKAFENYNLILKKINKTDSSYLLERLKIIFLKKIVLSKNPSYFRQFTNNMLEQKEILFFKLLFEFYNASQNKKLSPLQLERIIEAVDKNNTGIEFVDKNRNSIIGNLLLTIFEEESQVYLKLKKENNGYFHGFFTQKLPEPDLFLAFLEKAINFDPSNPVYYQKAINFCIKCSNEKKCNYWIDLALKKLPENLSILLMAAKLSRKKGALKKAAAYLEQVLILNPIDQQAKREMGQCYLDHAFKSIKNSKFLIAEKELTSAAECVITREDQIHLNFSKIYFEMIKNDYPNNRQISGDFVLLDLHKLIDFIFDFFKENENKLISAPFTVLLKNQLLKDQKKEDMLYLLNRINDYDNINFSRRHGFHIIVKDKLSNMTEIDWSLNDLELIFKFAFDYTLMDMETAYIHLLEKKYSDSLFLKFISYLRSIDLRQGKKHIELLRNYSVSLKEEGFLLLAKKASSFADEIKNNKIDNEDYSETNCFTCPERFNCKKENNKFKEHRNAQKKAQNNNKSDDEQMDLF